MSIITKAGKFAQESLNKINSETFTSGKVIKKFVKTQSDTFQNSIKNLNKDEKLKTKVTTVIEDLFKSIKKFDVKGTAEAAKKQFVDEGPTKFQKAITKGIKSIGVFIAGVLTTLGLKKAEKSDEAPDYVSCSCCE